MNTRLILPGFSPGLMSKLHLWSFKLSSFIIGFYCGRQIGLLHRTLAYGNSRFCILKFTKPVDERDLQAMALPSQTSHCGTVTRYRNLLITKH